MGVLSRLAEVEGFEPTGPGGQRFPGVSNRPLSDTSLIKHDRAYCIRTCSIYEREHALATLNSTKPPPPTHSSSTSRYISVRD